MEEAAITEDEPRGHVRALIPKVRPDQVAFCVTDPIRDNDVYFEPPNGPLTSEVLKRRDP